MPGSVFHPLEEPEAFNVRITARQSLRFKGRPDVPLSHCGGTVCGGGRARGADWLLTGFLEIPGRGNRPSARYRGPRAAGVGLN
ncbi:unnamed protein product [Boreogadus saida]